MRNPFELSDPDLTNLNPQEAVAFARRLLWAEAAFTGISQRLVSVPQCINMRDGGLDARIEESVSPSRDDLIPEGLSGFQIKASDLTPNQCKNEVCVRDDLRGRTVAHRDAGGRAVHGIKKRPNTVRRAEPWH